MSARPLPADLYGQRCEVCGHEMMAHVEYLRAVGFIGGWVWNADPDWCACYNCGCRAAAERAV